MKFSYGNGCRYRVMFPGDTDTSNCGDPILAGGLCAAHRIESADALRASIRASLRDVALMTERLEQIDGDDVRDMIALQRGFGVRL